MGRLFEGILSWMYPPPPKKRGPNKRAALKARLAQAEQDRDGYRESYLKLESEVGQARADAQGYKESYLKLESEVGQARADAQGYRESYLRLESEVSQAKVDAQGYKESYLKLESEVSQAKVDAQGYKESYLKLESEVGQARVDAQGYRESYLKLESEVGQAKADAEGYKGAYEEASTELSRFRCLLREAPTPTARPRQFVFLHIQKTGGISLLDFFGQHFDWYRTLWVFSPTEFDGYAPTEIAHFDRVCGHFSARNLASVRPDAFLCTFLREPIERVISSYWYFRTYRGQMRDSIRHAVESARSKTFLEFLQDPAPEVRRHVANHQAHALAGDWAAPDDRPAADLLAGALETLSRFDSIGLTEEIDAGLARICRMTGWASPARLPRLNATTNRQTVGDLSAAEWDLVRELTEVDAAVYRAAQARIASEG